VEEETITTGGAGGASFFFFFVKASPLLFVFLFVVGFNTALLLRVPPW
jgi:hypothetical protein